MIQEDGLYVYGVAAGANGLRFGPVGLDGREVYTVPGSNLCAIVHRCPATPYQSPDKETVVTWIRAHQAVLERAQKIFGTVIPAGFDTILRSRGDAASTDQAAEEWLVENSRWLAFILAKIDGKDEYGVQILCSRLEMERRLPAENPEIKNLTRELSEKPPGTAFLYQQLIAREMKIRTEALAKEWTNDFYARIRPHCEDIAVEKASRAAEDKVALLNLSCLVAKEEVVNLTGELEGISNITGISVRFSGPWPPYSFVAKPAAPVEVETGR